MEPISSIRDRSPHTPDRGISRRSRQLAKKDSDPPHFDPQRLAACLKRVASPDPLDSAHISPEQQDFSHDGPAKSAKTPGQHGEDHDATTSHTSTLYCRTPSGRIIPDTIREFLPPVRLNSWDLRRPSCGGSSPSARSFAFCTPAHRIIGRVPTPEAPRKFARLESWEIKAMTHGGSSEWGDDEDSLDSLAAPTLQIDGLALSEATAVGRKCSFEQLEGDSTPRTPGGKIIHSAPTPGAPVLAGRLEPWEVLMMTRGNSAEWAEETIADARFSIPETWTLD